MKEEENKCLHCGADNGRNPVVWEGKAFCCQGCEQVYRILNEKKLINYYSLEKTPGIKVNEEIHESKYTFLDRVEVQQKLYEFQEEELVRVRFYIPGIHCASCIWLLEQLNRLNPGVLQSSVNFIKKELTVTFLTNKISLRQLVELLVSIHYIPDISLQSLDRKEVGRINKKLMYKIGVAGFVFGNVMLYSLPEYFNGEPLKESLGSFLYYMSFVLTVPLVFYSGSDYLISAFKNLRKGIINVDLPIALGLLALFSVTCYEVLSGSGPGYSDSLSGFLFFLLIGKWYQDKTYQALSFDRDYKSYFPVAVTRLSEKGEESALLSELSEGDLLLIRNRELIPADGLLLEGTALIDYSFVTGESRPVRKEKGEPLYAGGVQTSGVLKMKLTRDVEQSHLTQLWNQNSNATKKSIPWVSIIDRISVWFTLSIILIALSGFAWWLIMADLRNAILVLTSVLIVACPCALALSLPFTLGSTMRILGKKGLYLKNTEVIQKLGKIDCIVFDKTGTLTQPDQSEILFTGDALSPEEEQYVLSLCNQSIHPLSQALARQFKTRSPLPNEEFVEVPGRGLFARIGSKEIRLGAPGFVGHSDTATPEQASRVYLSIDSAYRGYFSINNSYRPGFQDLIKDLKLKFQLYLLSGDNASEKEKLAQFFPQGHLHFNQQPEDKMHFISGLKNEGQKVLMIGDGLNDAGAFLQSDVALSIADDIYHFSPAGDAILEARKFDQLNHFIRMAGMSLTVVKLSFVISLFYNLVGLGFALSGQLSPVVAAILMPASSISVVAFATFSTRLLGKMVLK